MLPHDRRRGCDSCNITKTARRDRFHRLIVIIDRRDKIDECGGNDVRQMTDGRGRVIVFLVAEDQRLRTE